MDTLQDILLTLLMVGGIVIVGVFVSVMLAVRRAIDNIGADVRRLTEEMLPMLAKMQETVDQTKDALSVITENRATLSAAANNIRKVTENIYRLENILQEQLEPGITGLARRLAGIRRGIETFLDNWRRER